MCIITSKSHKSNIFKLGYKNKNNKIKISKVRRYINVLRKTVFSNFKTQRCKSNIITNLPTITTINLKVTTQRTFKSMDLTKINNFQTKAILLKKAKWKTKDHSLTIKTSGYLRKSISKQSDKFTLLFLKDIWFQILILMGQICFMPKNNPVNDCQQ